MDLSHPAAILSGLLIGLIGTSLFIYGKKQSSGPCLVTGGALCVFPCFVTSVAVLWGITALCLGGLYAASRRG